jgi:hypothetical protein
VQEAVIVARTLWAFDGARNGSRLRRFDARTLQRSLAWDVATLIHAGEPPDELIDRLRDRDNFQGARYELAIAAIIARLECSITWLDADPGLRTVKHVEFEATHRPTGQTFAVEAKSRHPSGRAQPSRHAGSRRPAAR